MLTLLLLLAVLTVVGAAEAFAGPGGRRRSRRANLALALPVLVAGTVTDVAVVAATTVGDEHDAGVLGWLGLRGGAAVVLGVVLLDLIAYASHRSRHAVGPLWAAHRTHHTDVDVDVSTTFRHHPLDVVALNLTTAVAIAVLGIGAGAVAVMAVLTPIIGVAAHGRVRLPAEVERAIGLVLQTPGLHRTHHSPRRQQTDSNFGLVLTAWDRLFGTYCAPDWSRPVGLDTVDLDQRQSVGALLAEPWRPLVRERSAARSTLSMVVSGSSSTTAIASGSL